MKRLIAILIGGILLDFFYFPTWFTFIPTSINSKMILAGGGVAIFIYKMIRKRELLINSDGFQLIGLSFLVSFAGLISITYNGTSDTSYATYFVSAGTWFMGAYFVIEYLKAIHKNLSLEILIHYLVAVCTFQCIIAKVIDTTPAVSDFVDRFFYFGQEGHRLIKRIYGIAAVLDVAGIRFSVVLVLMFYLLSDDKVKKNNAFYFFYMLSIIIIIGLGNIIARTTIIGALLGFAYFLYRSFIQGSTLKGTFLKAWTWLLGILIFTLPIFVFYYNTDAAFHKNIRFAFEGFFSLAEKGKWEVSSNEVLKDMYVYPETLKTWIIGDGYFASPASDPHFLGYAGGGFYMGTDVGYSRFLFYFGALGLIAFSLFLIKSAIVCSKKNPQSTIVMILLLLVNFSVWLKVSTDIFLIFALLLCLPEENLEATQEQALLTDE